ncbi:MAG: thiamine pyrophosphate-dependent enzyme [Myxococcota bacterium]
MTADDALAAVRDADAALAALDPTPFPLPVGELAAVVAGAVSALGRGDWWVPSVRERVGAVVRGVPVERLRHGLLGARPFKVAPPGGSPAVRALIAVGLAHADPTGGALVHLGIGSASDGAFHEALNLAALLRPNVVFVVSVHPLTGDAPLGRQLATTPAALATAFGIDAVVIDGSDAAAVHAAVTAARAVPGPHLIEARLRVGQEVST